MTVRTGSAKASMAPRPATPGRMTIAVSGLGYIVGNGIPDHPMKGGPRQLRPKPGREEQTMQNDDQPLPKGSPRDWTMSQLEDFGRIRLSDHFFMRDMLYSEVASIHGLRNVPDDPALAVEVGKQLCTTLLEPLHATFGHVSIRSHSARPRSIPVVKST